MDNTTVSSKPTSSKANNFDGGNSSSGKPIRFVYCDEDDNGKFKLDPDAISVLNQIQGPLAVVSVCGPPRQGKSFVLNQLLGRSSGFQVVPTQQPWTKGLWIWSTPLKRTTLDGTEYNLLLMDSGGSNGHDQMGVHRTQVFSLAVLVSSLFIYNQVGLIDEAALDHLSLITEMTKHIHGRASKGNDSVSEIGHFSPVFMWLLRDFYLDLKENDKKITPRDYLELSFRPIMGNGKDIAAKNQIRESIRAVFPNRECFALVRPLNNEIELQHLDQVTLDKLRPEFQSGLDIFTKFVHERTRPKQVGGTAMTGPFLARITKSLIDVLNDGAFPTLSSSWQLYPSNAIMEADLQCSNAIQLMENKLQGACQVPNARIENVLESLISEYEASVHGPTKWQKLSSFLQKSLQGTILQQAKKQIDEVSSENKSLVMKCRQLDNKIEVLQNQLQANEKSKAECQKCYENAINDFQKLYDQYKNRIKNLESKCRVLEEQHSRSLEMLDAAKQVSLEWERKYEEILTEERATNHQDNGQTEVRKSRIFKAAEESKLALKMANELNEKYEIALNEAKISIKKTTEEAMLREEDLIARFNKSLAEKEEEMKEKITKLEQAETKIGNYELELSELKLQMKELSEKYESVKSAAQSLESETQRLVEERIQLEQKYLSELKSVEEARLRDKVAEEEGTMANELNIQNEKVTVDRFVQTESADIHIETSEREKTELAGEIEISDASDGNASSKVALLEATVRERDQEVELLKKKCEQLELMGERERLILHFQRDLTPDNSNDSVMDAGVKTYSGMKRPRLDVSVAGLDEEIASETKEPRTPSALQRCTTTLAESVFTPNEADSESQKEAASVDHTKFTVVKLKQELKEHGFDDELQKLKHPKKKDILHLYKKLVLKM